MKNILTGLCRVAILIGCIASVPFAGLPDSRPAGAINDYASILSAQTRSSLEALSVELLQKAGVSSVLVTVTDLEGAEIGDVATRLFEKWGIGKKGVDEGVLVLVAVKDRLVRIETGYGSEGYLTDALSKRIIGAITPALSQGRWDEGLSAAMIDIAAIAAKAHAVSLDGISATVAEQRIPLRVHPVKVNVFGLLFFIVLVLFLLSTRGGRSILLFMLFSSLSSSGRSSGRGFGGGFGNGGFSGFGGGMSGGGGATGRF